MESKKVFIIVMLLIVISITAVVCYINKDTFFTSTGTITYNNGCVEHYKRDKLIGAPCVNESNKPKTIIYTNYNMSDLNITLK
jgi:hypothetical protein